MFRASHRLKRDFDCWKTISIPSFQWLHGIHRNVLIEPEVANLIKSLAKDAGSYALVGIFTGWPVASAVEYLFEEAEAWPSFKF